MDRHSILARILNLGPHLALGIVLLACVSYGLPALHYGFDMFLWDDSEYMGQILDAQDAIAHRGIACWPYYFAFEQNTKPPLYVNTVTPFALLLGRDRLIVAVATVDVLLSWILVIGVFVIMRPLTNPWQAMLAAIAVISISGFTCWLPTAHPDAQLGIIALGSVLLLATGSGCWSFRRAMLLGVLLGLGMLAKTTFAVHLGLPIAYWIAFGGRQGASIKDRLRTLSIAGAACLFVALPWYWHNFGGAFYYAELSSVIHDQLGLHVPLIDRIKAWTSLALFEGMGFFTMAILAYATAVSMIGLFLPPRRSTSIPADIHLYLLLAAVPMCLLCFSNQTTPNTRHLLPACILFSFSIVIFALQAAERFGNARMAVVAPVVLLIAAQGLLALVALNPSYSQRILASAYREDFLRVTPVPRGLPSPPEAHLLAFIKDFWRVAPETWYLSGNTSYLNASRLRLPIKAAALPVQIAWCSYLTWSEDNCRSFLDGLRKLPSIIICYEPSTTSGSMDAMMNKNNGTTRSFLNDAANGFVAIPGTSLQTPAFHLELYSNSPPILEAFKARLKK